MQTDTEVPNFEKGMLPLYYSTSICTANCPASTSGTEMCDTVKILL